MIQISHLRALSSFSVSNQLQRQIIIHDMIETLKWLNENVGIDSWNTLYELRDDDIFLNVDNPSTEPWIWTNANQLAFEGEDSDGIRCVRTFLLPYEKLLRAAGVVQVFHPQCPVSNINESESATLRSIRTGFNDLRRKGLWTDVVFVTRGDDDDTTVPSLVAHRSFLTVFSDYFSDSFCGDFKEANDASSSNPIKFPVTRDDGEYYPATCVELLLGAFHLYFVVSNSSCILL
jgi:sacsin